MTGRRIEDSWEAGFGAGASGGSPTCPADVPDEPAYASGYLEGQAAAYKMRLIMSNEMTRSAVSKLPTYPAN